MKLAINYSEAAESLVKKEKIHIDLFKCADSPVLVKRASLVLPVTVHFNFQVGHYSLSSLDWETLDQLFNTTHTLYINLHLEPDKSNHEDIPIDAADPIHIEIIAERIIQEIQPLLKHHPAGQIIIENAIYRIGDGRVLKAAVVPAIFHMIMNEIDCGLLLDISHARITAHQLGIDEREYISSLPVNKLREIHFTGLHPIDGKLIDHLPILAQDWPILDWVLAEIQAGNFSRPWLLVYEYGGVGEKYIDRSDPEVIAAQVPELYRRVQSL